MISTRERLKEGSSRPQSLARMSVETYVESNRLPVDYWSVCNRDFGNPDGKGFTMRISGTDPISKH